MRRTPARSAPDAPAAAVAGPRHPLLRRLGRPEEAADAVLFLACDRGSFTTGGEIYVDGGINQFQT